MAPMRWHGLRLALALMVPVLLLVLMPRLVAPVPDARVHRIGSADFLVSDGEGDGDSASQAALVRRSLPHDWRGRDETSSGWYFFQHELPTEPNRLWGLWLPRVDMNAIVYVNGDLVGVEGSVDIADVSRMSGRPLYFHIPNGVLRSGPNAFAIRVVSGASGSGLLREVYLAPTADLDGVHRLATLVGETTVQVTALLLALSAAFMLGLWSLRPREAVIGWYAVMLAIWALHDIHHVVNEPPVDWAWMEWLWHATLAGLVVAFNRVVDRFLERREPGVEARMLAWAGVAAVAPAVALVVDAPLSPGDLYPVIGSSAALLAVRPCLNLLKHALRDRSPLSTALLSIALIALLFGLHDWFVSLAWLDRRNGYLLPYAALPVMLVFGLVLTRRFGRALAELETLNLQLESRVKAREAELESNFARLRALERDQAIAGERVRVMRDIHDGLGGLLMSALSIVEAGPVDAAKAAGVLRAAIEDLRLMIDSLDPVDGDLASSLGMLRSRIAPRLEAAGLQMQWAVGDLAGHEHLSTPDVLQLLRILQEGLNNVIKHAHASVVRLSAGTDPGAGLWIELRDDGVGIDTDTPGPLAVRGRGLSNMRRRAADIGASIAIEPTRPGTRIALRLAR